MKKNRTTPQQETRVMPEATQDDDALDAAIESALSAEKPPVEAETKQGMSAKDQAELEARLQVQKLAEIATLNGEQPAAALPPADEETLVSVAARGRQYLMDKLREHAQKPKPEYVPPPITERMQERINAEMEAGRRAVERHAAQQAARPAPQKEKWDGSNTKVFRPNDVVPDPLGGSGKFDATA